MPKIFRLTKSGKLIEDIFEGATINTPSMLAVEDALDGLRWAESLGGLHGLMARNQANISAIVGWVCQTENFAFLAKQLRALSPISVCLVITAPWFLGLGANDQVAAAKQMINLLDAEGVAFDIDAYRDAPAGLRIWAGATVEVSDLNALFPWLEWALSEASKIVEAA